MRDDVAKHLRIGRAALHSADLLQAEAHFRIVTRIAPDLAEGHLRLALTLASPGRTEEAIASARQALVLDPTLTHAHGFLAGLYQRLGRFPEAIEEATRAIELSPNLCPPYIDIVRCKRLTEADHALITKLGELLEEPERTDIDRMILRFALGKAYDDLGQCESAIQHFDAANHLGYHLFGPRSGYDMAAQDEAVLLTKTKFRKNPPTLNVGSTSELPVFVVGMIRSGTTLLDSMLSKHSKVASAGELKFWDHESTDLFQRLWKDRLSVSALQPVADRFLTRLRKVGMGKPRVIDKMPLNYNSMGLIHAALPNARFIHLKRNPLDTALSIWTTEFGNGAPRFAYRKDHIVHAYREYLDLMKLWREMIPGERLLEIDYEGLVTDPEATLRRTVGFLGLEWDENVLNTTSPATEVMTPSRWQVRQPVYQRSVGRWRNYQPWLGDLKTLGDLHSVEHA